MLGFRGRGRMKANVCAWFVVALTGIGVVSCDGGGILGGGSGDSCRSNDDCGSDLYCFGPNRPNVCGIPPREFCASNADCPMGDVCQAIFDSCSQDGLGSECNVPCNANSCGMGFRCNAGGACEPIPCDEGFTCPDRQKCDSALAHDMTLPVHARTNGCVNIDCMADSGCPTGKFCVDGYCQDGLGTCGEEMIVP